MRSPEIRVQNTRNWGYHLKATSMERSWVPYRCHDTYHEQVHRCVQHVDMQLRALATLCAELTTCLFDAQSCCRRCPSASSSIT